MSTNVISPVVINQRTGIVIPALELPTLNYIQHGIATGSSGWQWLESIERNTAPTRQVELVIRTIMLPDEGSTIKGDEYEKRLIPLLYHCLGIQHRQWLEEDGEIWEYLEDGFYLDFPGIVLRHECHYGRYVPSLGYKERGGRHWSKLEEDFRVVGRVAIGLPNSKPRS